MRTITSTLLAVLLIACSAVGGTPEPVVEPVRVGAGPDQESGLLAHVIAALLEHEGLPAEVVRFSGARDVRQAVELGAVDVQPAYTGEAWLEDLGHVDPPGDPKASFAGVRDHDDEGLVWIRPQFGEGFAEPPANATFAFVVRQEAAEQGLRTLSQLAAQLSAEPDAAVCVDPEFGVRPDGLQAVLAAYSVRSDRPFLAADAEEAVRGVIAGDCLAGLTTATDGAAWEAGLLPLVDDLRVFPAFVPLPQVREDALEERPRIRRAVEPLAHHLTTELLGRWNARVVGGDPLDLVADDAADELLARAGRGGEAS